MAVPRKRIEGCHGFSTLSVCHLILHPIALGPRRCRLVLYLAKEHPVNLIRTRSCGTARAAPQPWEVTIGATNKLGPSAVDETTKGSGDKLKTNDYERALARLHVELVKLQQWVVHSGAKICIVFEGRDGAGKGRTIKAITERVSPRVFRVVALPRAHRAREVADVYSYITHLPAAGEIVIFDRSWLNHAGHQRVMGFCTVQQAQRFLQMTPATEKAFINSGLILLKYWLEVSQEEQTRRLEARIDDGRKTWKASRAAQSGQSLEWGVASRRG